MRIKHKLSIQIADDTDMKDKFFAPDDTLAEVVIDSYEKQSNSIMEVESEQTEDVPFGDVVLVRGIYIKADKDCEITINGGDPIQLQRASEADGATAKFFMEGVITAAQIISPEDETTRAIVAVWGDAADE